MKCSHCGEIINNDIVFCSRCGYPVPTENESIENDKGKNASSIDGVDVPQNGAVNIPNGAVNKLQNDTSPQQQDMYEGESEFLYNDNIRGNNYLSHNKRKKSKLPIIIIIIIIMIVALVVGLCFALGAFEDTKEELEDTEEEAKYIEKSKVGKDIASLDSVRSAVHAEITDAELCILCTEADGSFGTNDTLDGYYLDTLNTLTTGDANFQTLFNRLFGNNHVGQILADEFRNRASANGNTSVLKSNAALNAQAKICIFLDGNGGVAVAAVDASGNIVTYDDLIFFVSSNIDIDTISQHVRDGRRIVNVS